MSASRLAVSGAHSGGLATTVFPAASAGAIRQVASMSGAFHGVITAVTPAGAQETCSRWPEISRPPPSSSPSQSAKKRKLCATRGITLRRWERSSAPLSRVSTCDRSSIRRSMPSAIACRTAARSGGGVRDQPSNASRAARTAAATSASPPRATSASGCPSMGDRSVNVPGDATRRPPIQCRVSTATPATSASLIAIPCSPNPCRPPPLMPSAAACRPPPPVPLAARRMPSAVRRRRRLARPAALVPSRGRPARQVRLAPNFMNCPDVGQGRCRRPS